jgi:hypothetical protein
MSVSLIDCYEHFSLVFIVEEMLFIYRLAD